jgi:hypothetical protein
MPIFVVNPLQRILGIHFPAGDGNDRAGNVIAIWDMTSITRSRAVPFLARLGKPDAAAARWDWTALGGVRGRFIVGDLQPALGGDYAYALGNRTDPENIELRDLENFRLPEDGEIDSYYLWHCGNTDPTAILYHSVIINIAKIYAEFGSAGDPYPMGRVDTATTGQIVLPGGALQGAGTIQWRLRFFGGEAAPSFSADSDGQVLCNLDPRGFETGEMAPSIVYGTEYLF